MLTRRFKLKKKGGRAINRKVELEADMAMVAAIWHALGLHARKRKQLFLADAEQLALAA